MEVKYVKESDKIIRARFGTDLANLSSDIVDTRAIEFFQNKDNL